ncbi:spermatogenesis-associated protein 22 [Trichomycterus rosablanca]|uniref:spermatogenesis-associated protein 22 n=1 Tax=Trichomycterus rosablanca TaxID=2290929 RepID=UPI002F35ADAC
MRRNESQPRPTAGCLAVPLFNQKKRSRLPLTSNPSESEVCSGSEYRNVLGFTPTSHPSNAQGSTHRAPLAQRSQWNQAANLNPHPQQGKAWSSASPGYAGRGYAPAPFPNKPTWSQPGPQRPPGRQNTMATTSVFRQDGFASGSGTAQTPNKPVAGKQATKQQPSSGNTGSARGPFNPSHPTAQKQRPATQGQSSQWKFKSVGVTGGGTWVEDTFGISASESSLHQQKSAASQVKPVAKKSLRILTAVIDGMKHWSQFKDKVPMMFEVFGTLDSAVTIGKFGAKNFLIRDGKDVVPCVYYENDQALPRLIRGQVHRCVGNYDRQKNIFTCVSVRAASPSEQRNAQQAVKASDAEMRNVVGLLDEI